MDLECFNLQTTVASVQFSRMYVMWWPRNQIKPNSLHPYQILHLVWLASKKVKNVQCEQKVINNQ